MNRLILIGNGFDLAQGLKTKYEHFINDYWDKKVEALHELYHKNLCLYHGSSLSQRIFEDNDILIKDIEYRIYTPLNKISNKKGYENFNAIILSIIGKQNNSY